MKNKKILITGGAGFIGSRLVRSFVKQGADVTIIDRLSTGSLENIEPVLDKIHLIQADLQQPDELKKLNLSSYDYLFHLAANAYVPTSVENPAFDLNLNLMLTFQILELMRSTKKSPHLIFASTAAVYGNPKKLPITETDPVDPISPYGVSKLAAERYAYVFSKLYGLKTTTLRFFSVYGPGQRKQVVFDMVEKIRQNPKKYLTIKLKLF
jgi:UDP-glucose 4-epimerase